MENNRSGIVHGRSGSVALPRTKVVPAMAAAGLAALARSPARRAGVVRRRVDMLAVVEAIKVKQTGQLGLLSAAEATGAEM